MTLVLPYCSDQSKNLFFKPKMPCVFDGEHLDFESALMSTDWPTLKDIAADYGPASDDTTSTKPVAPGSNTKHSAKRKLTDVVSCEEAEPKRACTENPVSCSFAEISSEPTCELPQPLADCTKKEVEAQDEPINVTEEDEEIFMPRRRVLQMWNSRQRWKDERKRVLKMSVSKLTEIEDPELWLLRSVLINNTIKRLHQDIRNERQAKVRHRQQKIDFYNEKYETPFAVHQRLHTPTYESETSNSFNGTQHHEDKKPELSSTSPSDSYEDTSCDEIFGISEDFLRVTIPDRRVSSPIPTNPVQDPVEQDCDKSSVAMEVDISSKASSCSLRPVMDCDTHSSPCNSEHDSSESESYTLRSKPTGRSISQRHIGSGNQCATQFRTNTSSSSSDGDNSNLGGDSGSVFAPRVPILDTVVYHSLLASLESS